MRGIQTWRVFPAGSGWDGTRRRWSVSSCLFPTPPCSLLGESLQIQQYGGHQHGWIGPSYLPLSVRYLRLRVAAGFERDLQLGGFPAGSGWDWTRRRSLRCSGQIKSRKQILTMSAPRWSGSSSSFPTPSCFTGRSATPLQTTELSRLIVGHSSTLYSPPATCVFVV